MNLTLRNLLLLLAACSFALFAACSGGEETDDGGTDTGEDVMDNTDTGDTGGTDVDEDTGGTCGEGQTSCVRSRDCEGSGLNNPVCEAGCCVEGAPPACVAHGDPCESGDQSTDQFLCSLNEDGTGECLARCQEFLADSTESEDCPRNSWCVPVDEAPAENPNLDGVCVPGDCTSIFGDDCADGTCLPIGNGASFCINAGTAGDGDECFANEGAECSSDDDCGANETCTGGACYSNDEICGAGLLCQSGECVTPCDLDDDTCEGDLSCVEVFDTTRDNRPGLCATPCDDFSAGQCPEGESCTPVTGRADLNAFICIEDSEEVGEPNGECNPDEDVACPEGYVCLNEGSEEEPTYRCAQWCDTTGGDDSDFSQCTGASAGAELIAATAYGTASAYTPLAADDYTVVGLADGSEVGSWDVTLEDGTVYTVLATFDDAGDVDAFVLVDSEDGDTLPATGARIVHASADGLVDLSLATLLLEDVAYTEMSGWFEVDTDDTVNAHVLATGTTTVAASFTELAFTEGVNYGVVVYGTTAGTGLATAVLAYDAATDDAPSAGNGLLSFFHGADGAGAVDVYVDCATADDASTCLTGDLVATGFGYGTQSDWFDLAAGTYTFNIVAAGADTSDLGVDDVIAEGVEVDVEDAAVTTVLIGSATDFVSYDFDDSAEAGTALANIVHLSSDAGNVDVIAETLDSVIDDLDYGDTIEGEEVSYMDFDDDTYVALVRASDAAFADLPLFISDDIVVELDSLYTLVATGSLTDDSFEILAFADDNTAPEAGNAHLRFIHAAVGAADVSLNAPGQAEFSCFPSAANGLGFCLEGCAPYPRQGEGNYERCEQEGATCRPFVATQSELVDIEGVCIGFTGSFEIGAPCETDFAFECDDFGLCADLDFNDTDEPVCKALCEPFSTGQCSDGAFCSPLFPLFGNQELGLCDELAQAGAHGDACTDQQIPCSEDGTLCLDLGQGLACTEVCRAGHPEDCETGTCRTGVFNPPIPTFMGVCI